jgi:hypothetical protein
LLLLIAATEQCYVSDYSLLLLLTTLLWQCISVNTTAVADDNNK